jgi:hypothetical protein
VKRAYLLKIIKTSNLKFTLKMIFYGTKLKIRIKCDTNIKNSPQITEKSAQIPDFFARWSHRMMLLKRRDIFFVRFVLFPNFCLK